MYRSTADDLSTEERLRILPPAAADITKPHTLAPVFDSADVVINLVGIMHGKPSDFADIQWKGAANVARVARDAGAKVIHISAIGANPESHVPYARTKGFGELAVLETCPDATIIRPSILFGPGDGFFGVSRMRRVWVQFTPSNGSRNHSGSHN